MVHLFLFLGCMMTPSTDTQPPTGVPGFHIGGLLALGLVTNFLDALGVGSFATTTSVLRLGRVVDDEKIPGTLNIGHAVPTILEAALFLTAVSVDPLTFATLVATGALGAWFGTGTVVRWPRRTIQRAMAMALLITAILIVLRQINLFPSGGTAIGLTGAALLIAALASALIGSLTSLGIGNYAPTMAVTYMLGMDPKSVFPIMAASASLILPTAAIRFFRSGRFDRRTALGPYHRRSARSLDRCVHRQGVERRSAPLAGGGRAAIYLGHALPFSAGRRGPTKSCRSGPSLFRRLGCRGHRSR